MYRKSKKGFKETYEKAREIHNITDSCCMALAQVFEAPQVDITRTWLPEHEKWAWAASVKLSKRVRIEPGYLVDSLEGTGISAIDAAHDLIDRFLK